MFLTARPNIFGRLFLLVVDHVFHRAYFRTGGGTGEHHRPHHGKPPKPPKPTIPVIPMSPRE